MQSRLSKTKEGKVKKQLFLSVAGIIVVLYLLIKFGIPLLTNVSLSLSSKSSGTQQDTTTSKAIIAAPILNQSFSATNSASITVSGTAVSKETIQLFVNDSQVDSTTAKDDGSFSFANVNLTQQQNSVKAKAKLQDPSTSSGQVKTSDFSDTWTVAYIQKAPSLTVDSPHNGDTFDGSHKTIVVKGKTDPDAHVTINDFWAIIDSNGNYSYSLTLSNGDNHIVITATDKAGNTTKQELTVKSQ